MPQRLVWRGQSGAIREQLLHLCGICIGSQGRTLGDGRRSCFIMEMKNKRLKAAWDEHYLRKVIRG